MIRLLRISAALCLALPTVAGAEQFDSQAIDRTAASSTTETLEADVVVYGDASGGVAAAVQAARMGKRTLLISQYGHLGGMTSSGLGWTDIGDATILGGICREFYQRVYDHYQSPAAWVFEDRADFANQGQGVPALDDRTGLASTFEPKVAEAIFDGLAAEAGVVVRYGRIDLDRAAKVQAGRIRSIYLEDGCRLNGRVFIDASYEGDLLGVAGVSFTTGRESNEQYGEWSNGITGPRYGNQLPARIDPYIQPGDPASGLLPGVNATMGGPVGAGDHRLQAYCYRMVLTDVPENRLPITKPADYRESDYEILFRAIEVGQRDRFFKTSPMPNRKTDSNNASGISFDFIEGNYGPEWDWTTLGHTEREEVAANHRNWQQGLLWTLQNHARVPESIRAWAEKWGLAKDEFPDNGGWPYNLYVREARRMVSDFVMTERHCKGVARVVDPIAMGAYTLDSHNTQRFISDGMVRNEGDIQMRLSSPYGIAYRAITPREAECENLLVPWALSATHIAFGSIRMEPVFMIIGQSAGTAASIAIDRDVAVQDVPYSLLRARLEADDQRLPHASSKKEAAVERVAQGD